MRAYRRKCNDGPPGTDATAPAIRATVRGLQLGTGFRWRSQVDQETRGRDVRVVKDVTLSHRQSVRLQRLAVRIDQPDPLGRHELARRLCHERRIRSHSRARAYASLDELAPVERIEFSH